MTYELCKELRKNNFPHDWHEFDDHAEDLLSVDWEFYKSAYCPDLSDLIEACPKPIQLTIMPNGFAQVCWLGGDGLCTHCPISEEAIARLWLALQEKKKEK